MSAAGFLFTRYGPVGSAWENRGVTSDYFRIVEMKVPNCTKPDHPASWIPLLDRKSLQWGRTGYVDYPLDKMSQDDLDLSTSRPTGPAESWLMVQEFEKRFMEER